MIGNSMITIHDFQNAKIIRKATEEEYERYKRELSKKSKDDQLSGEVSGAPYGIRGLIYMMEYPIRGFD